MTWFTRSAWFAATRRNAGAAALALLAAAAGCKKDSGSNLSKNDPLVGGNGRIPPQNLPFPGRGTASDPKGRGDPLLGSPTSGIRTAHAATGYTDDPDRWKNGLYVPNVNGTPAALAGRPVNDGEELKMDGVGLMPAGGSIPAPAAPAASPAPSEAALNQLAPYGVKRGDYSITRDNGQVIVRVNLRKDADSPVHGFTGQGATEALAVKQVIDQIKTAK